MSMDKGEVDKTIPKARSEAKWDLSMEDKLQYCINKVDEKIKSFESLERFNPEALKLLNKYKMALEDDQEIVLNRKTSPEAEAKVAEAAVTKIRYRYELKSTQADLLAKISKPLEDEKAAAAFTAFVDDASKSFEDHASKSKQPTPYAGNAQRRANSAAFWAKAEESKATKAQPEAKWDLSMERKLQFCIGEVDKKIKSLERGVAPIKPEELEPLNKYREELVKDQKIVLNRKTLPKAEVDKIRYRYELESTRANELAKISKPLEDKKAAAAFTAFEDNAPKSKQTTPYARNAEQRANFAMNFEMANKAKTRTTKASEPAPQVTEQHGMTRGK